MSTQIASSFIRYFELLAGLVGVYCYFKKRQSIWFSFAVFLLFNFGCETLGYWFGTHKMYAQNTIMYKWFVIPAIFLMYHFCYYNILIKKFKPLVLISYGVFLLLALWENLFLSVSHNYTINFSIAYGCVAILFFSLSYFYQLVQSDAILNFKSSMAFWFCLGVLIFWIGDFPELFFNNYFGKAVKTNLAITYRWIFIFLNYIMYLLFTMGFICSKPQK